MTDLLILKRGRNRLPVATLAPPTRVPDVVRAEGACVDAPADTFDIDHSQDDPDAARQAKALCGGCPVRQQCAGYALDNEPFGIWGGMDAHERLALRGAPLPSLEDRREAELIRDLFRRGFSAATIAQRYGVSSRTVERWKDEAGLVAHRADGDRRAAA